MAEEEDVCVLNGDELAESLVVLDLQPTFSFQEQTKRFNELKNSFSALLTAYKDLRQKLQDCKEENARLKRNNSSLITSQTMASQMFESYNQGVLAQVIGAYNARVEQMLCDVQNNNSPDATSTFLKAEIGVQCDLNAEIQNQHVFNETIDQTFHSANSTPEPPTADKDRTVQPIAAKTYTAVTSIELTDDADVSDIEQEIERQQKPHQTLLNEAALPSSKLGQLLLNNSNDTANNNNASEVPSTTNYHCPICSLEFTPETLEHEALGHVMQCTERQNQSVRTSFECPICGADFLESAKFQQSHFEDHVQACCEAYNSH